MHFPYYSFFVKSVQPYSCADNEKSGAEQSAPFLSLVFKESRVCLNVVDKSADGLDVLDLLVGNLDLKLVLN